VSLYSKTGIGREIDLRLTSNRIAVVGSGALVRHVAPWSANESTPEAPTRHVGHQGSIPA
jgi:hypothetical protein